MNRVMEVLMKRKSVRAYEEREIEPEIRAEILKATLRAPTAGNLMLYSILEITGQAIHVTAQSAKLSAVLVEASAVVHLILKHRPLPLAKAEPPPCSLLPVFRETCEGDHTAFKVAEKGIVAHPDQVPHREGQEPSLSVHSYPAEINQSRSRRPLSTVDRIVGRERKRNVRQRKHISRPAEPGVSPYNLRGTGPAFGRTGGGGGVFPCPMRTDHAHNLCARFVRISPRTTTRSPGLVAATAEMQGIALEVRPDLVTLVPEKREELTTEGGLEVFARVEVLKEYIGRLQNAGIPVSLFIDPDEQQIAAAKKTGAAWVEIHTGAYANASIEHERDTEFGKIVDSAKLASSLGLRVGAGHGLNYVHVKAIARIREVEELNIGHSIISRAALAGMDRAVRDMIELVR